MCVAHVPPEPRETAGAIDRRGFLKAAAAASALAAAGTTTGGTPARAATTGRAPSRQVPVEQISIQLFSLRDQLGIDLDGTFAALHDIGYQRVEHAGFVGRSVDAFKDALDAHDLWASSGHVQIPQPFDPAVWQDRLDEALHLGSHYIVHPFFGIDFGTGAVLRQTDGWRAFAHDLNRAGEMARAVGVRLGYHNHNWEFFRLTDDPTRTAYDVLTAETDRRLVHLEIDLFWAWRGAHDPVDLIADNPRRVLQFHVKDIGQDGSFTDPGQGLGDFPHVFAHARRGGTVEFIVERDDAGSPPRSPVDALTTAAVGFAYLRDVRF